jgi:DNA-binding LacI/PurR family transcriptional regulator
MSSVRHIAAEAGVSISTVSRALNNDPAVNPRTREIVLAVANRTGYVATVGRRVTNNIAFAYAGRQTISSVYDSALLEGIVRGADTSRFDVMLLNLQRDKGAEETYTQFFMRKGVRAVVLRTTSESRHVCQAIADENFPMVVISERFESKNVSFVDCDSKTDSIRAVEYLISLGHRRIALVMHVIPDCDHLDRFEGYREAMIGHGLPVDERLVLRFPANLSGGATAMAMLSRMANRPTAAFFADPMLAVGAVNKAHELGIQIPEDLSVVGFDDSDIRHSVYPTLTAVCQDAAQLGHEAALRLTRMLVRKKMERFQITLPSFFEANGSTGAPPVCRLQGPASDLGLAPGPVEVDTRRLDPPSPLTLRHLEQEHQ